MAVSYKLQVEELKIRVKKLEDELRAERENHRSKIKPDNNTNPCPSCGYVKLSDN